jgi:hypothetical protein
MTIAAKIQFKNQLKQFCRQQIENRIIAAKQAISNAQESANNEEKSSAGDKYETGRAMGHLQKDMHARQLPEYVKELSSLLAVNAGVLYDHATTGAFIETGNTSFFIAAGLGKQMIDGKQIFFLSPNAPLSNTLLNKKKGDGFVFNGVAVVIESVF